MIETVQFLRLIDCINILMINVQDPNRLENDIVIDEWSNFVIKSTVQFY